MGSLEFVACDRIRYGTIDVELSQFGSLDVLRDALAGAARTAIARAAGRSVVLQAHLRGRSELHGPLRAPQALAEVLASLRDDFTPADQWAWWDRLVDDSEPLIRLEDLRGGSDFAADLIAIAEGLATVCTEPALVPGLEASLPPDFLDDVTSTLPKSLRARALASELSARQLLEAGLIAALDELGAGEPMSQAVR